MFLRFALNCVTFCTAACVRFILLFICCAYSLTYLTDEITGSSGLILQWAHYPELIQNYHIKLVGWPSAIAFDPEKIAGNDPISMIEQPGNNT